MAAWSSVLLYSGHLVLTARVVAAEIDGSLVIGINGNSTGSLKVTSHSCPMAPLLMTETGCDWQQGFRCYHDSQLNPTKWAASMGIGEGEKRRGKEESEEEEWCCDGLDETLMMVRGDGGWCSPRGRWRWSRSQGKGMKFPEEEEKSSEFFCTKSLLLTT